MKRKILILTNNARMMLVFRREMLAALRRTYDIVLACPKDPSAEKGFTDLGIRTLNVPVDRRGMNPVKDALLFVRYLRLLRQEKPDAVITFTIKPNIYGAWAAFLLHIPCIATVEGLGSAWSGRAAPFVRRLYAAGLKKARLVFVLNDEIFSELKGVGIDPSVMKTLPGTGVNLTYFTPTPYPSDNPPSLLTIGRVMREKGFPELIRAAHVLKKELPNLVWHVVGAPEEREAALLSQLKECPNVVYHGPAKDVHPYYALCHATTTTYHEGMSTVCLEAAASARPILGTRVPGVKETFIEGKTGLGMDAGNSADTVRVIKTFFALSNQKRSEMGKTGRACIEEHFDRNKVTWSYFTVLESVYAKDDPEALDAALESIAQSTRLPEAVVLVKDGTLPEALERVIAKWQGGGTLRLLVVGYAQNKGLAHALSYGLQFVRTELVARMDSDDICVPDRFERQVAFMDSNPEIASSSGYIEEFETDPQRPVSTRRVPLTSEAIHRYLKLRSPFNYMAVMFRKSAVLAAGNYQSVPYFEDYDLWVRMDQKGFFGANLPVTLVYARIGNDMIGRRQGLSYCRHELFFLRRARESGFLSFPEYLAALVVRIPVRLLPKHILALVYKIVRMPSTRLVERIRAILQGGESLSYSLRVGAFYGLCAPASPSGFDMRRRESSSTFARFNRSFSASMEKGCIAAFASCSRPFAMPKAVSPSSFVPPSYARKVRFLFCLPLTLIGAFESCALGNRNPCAVFSDPFLGVTHEAF